MKCKAICTIILIVLFLFVAPVLIRWLFTRTIFTISFKNHHDIYNGFIFFYIFLIISWLLSFIASISCKFIQARISMTGRISTVIYTFSRLISLVFYLINPILSIIFKSISELFLGVIVIIIIRDCYKNTLIKINTCIIAIIFMVYTVSAIWEILTILFEMSKVEYDDNYATNDSSQLTTFGWIGIIQSSVISIIFAISITIIFNYKLHQYIQITTLNDAHLASPDRMLIINKIITKNNIIAWILFFKLINILTEPILSNIWSLSEIATSIFAAIYTYSEIATSILIIINIGTYYNLYKLSFKHTEKLFRYCYTNHLYKDELSQLLLVQKISVNDMQSNYKYGLNTDNCSITNCNALSYLIKVIKIHDNDQDIDIVKILNSFHHLLKIHDNCADFHIIYQQFKDTKICDIDNKCHSYLRHNRHRRKAAQIYKYNHKLSTEIIDNIHVYYIHSYHMMMRLNPNEIEQKEEKYEHNKYEPLVLNLTKIKQMRKKSKIFDDNLISNKFISSINITDIQANKTNNIYSVGERFNYKNNNTENSKLNVAAKYKSLKQEAINNKICCIETVKFNSIHRKAVMYMKTDDIKKISTQNNATVNQNQLIALLLYCNCDEYENKWSETFRRISYNETYKELVTKHSHFWHCSVHLRDLVEYFGVIARDTKQNRLFYHGINKLFCFKQTITQFKSPLSTSIEPAVAAQFATNDGIILELKYHSSTHPATARYFECAPFSDFSYEKECIWLGGIPIIIITNIINMQTNENYRSYIDGLNVLNDIMRGQKVSATTKAIVRCYKMLKNQCFENKYPIYIKELFNKYCNNVSRIIISSKCLLKDKKCKSLKQLLCLGYNNHVKCSIPVADFIDMKLLISLFPNLYQIEWFNTMNENHICEYILWEILKGDLSKYGNAKI
eukprot:63689_1